MENNPLALYMPPVGFPMTVTAWTNKCPVCGRGYYQGTDNQVFGTGMPVQKGVDLPYTYPFEH